MALFGIFCAIVLVAVISTSHAVDTYQPVKGNCTDLPIAKGYNSTKAATGEWYFHYGSFGKEGDKCSSGHAVQRGNENYVNNLLYNVDTSNFDSTPNDLTSDPKNPGIYTNNQGVVGYMLEADPNLDKYFYYIQCKEINNQTHVMVIVASRTRSTDDGFDTIYNDVSKMLKVRELLPNMHKINQTNCDDGM